MKNIINVVFVQNINGKEVLYEESKEIQLDIIKYDDEERVYFVQGVQDTDVYNFLSELGVYPFEKVNYDNYLKPLYLTLEFEKGEKNKTYLKYIEVYDEDGNLIDDLYGKLKYVS